MHFTESQRIEWLGRYAPLYRALTMGEETAVDASSALRDVVRAYEDGLPRVPFSRCPYTGEVQLHSFDPYGLDGPWWNTEAPVRPLLERIASCMAITGAVTLAEDVERFPYLCRPGPGLPFVYPRLLELDGVRAVVRQLPVGQHTAWAICYFALEMPRGVAMPNSWGTDRYWDAHDGVPGCYSTPEAPDEWDFSLRRWIARGKLFWIAPDDATLSLRTDIAGCPFLELPGEQRMQRIAHGRVSVQGEHTAAPSAAPPAAGETIGEFAMFALQPELRDELRLPPVPVPVRQRRVGTVFPNGGPVNLAAMLAEVQAFVAAFPAADGAYLPLQAGLAILAGLAATERGAHEEALQCYTAGLEAAPTNLVLCSHEALALHALGRLAEARTKLEAIVRTVPRGEILPLVWMLLIRRYHEDGEPAKATPLLDDLAVLGEQDASVARFVAEFSGAVPATPSSATVAPSMARPVSVPPSTPAATAEPTARASSAAPRRRRLWPVLVALLVGAGAFATWRWLGPDGLSGNALKATLGLAPKDASAPANDAVSLEIVQDLVGIWSLTERGCASGFRVAFTPDGRYGSGNERSGEEGRYQVRLDRLVETIAQSYVAADDASARTYQPVAKRYEYLVQDASPTRLVLTSGEVTMAFVRCPSARHVFADRTTFP